MAETTAIEWTDATWTPIRARRFEPQNDGGGRERIGWHCEHVSDGCRHCYAEGINRRLGTGLEFKPVHMKHRTPLGDQRGDVEVFLDEEMLLHPLRWRRPRQIFVCSMTDAFARFVTDQMLDSLFAVMALAPRHTFQVLTKRSARMRKYLNDREVRNRVIGRAWSMLGRLPKYKHEGITGRPWPLPNAWIGVSAEDQPNANERVTDLMQAPATVRFVSYEPALGPINFRQIMRSPADSDWIYCDDVLSGQYATKCGAAPGPRLDWIVQGGESGLRARPAHPDWFRRVRDDCAATGVALMHKQNGAWVRGGDLPADISASTCCDFDGALTNDDERVWNVGKKAAGRLLDGVTHDGMPAAHLMPALRIIRRAKAHRMAAVAQQIAFSERMHALAAQDDPYWDFDDDETLCTRCGGSGDMEADDPLNDDCDQWGMTDCAYCQGTGERRHQVIF